MEDRFKFRGVNEITGVFVLTVLAVLIAAIVWTGRSQRWFKSNVNLRIVLPEGGAAGIRQGSEVYFLGTLVGSVSDVVVDTTGRMEAQAKMRRDFFRFVRADSTATVKRKFGVAGDSFFEIKRGEGKPLPEIGASISCDEQLQSALEAAVEEIRHEVILVLKKVNGGLETWSSLGVDLRQTRRHLDQLTVRLDKMAGRVEAGEGTAGRWIADAALADEAQKLLAGANAAMTGLRGVVTNLQAGAAPLPQIAKAVADEARDLPGLVLQAHSSMRELERLVAALQKHWLVRKHVNQSDPPPVRPSREDVPKKAPVKPVRSPRDAAR
jgi:phospholipid/cholesterol/gamma-HCH transport system substrate-binding protein